MKTLITEPTSIAPKVTFVVTGFEQTRDMKVKYDEQGHIIDIIPGDIHSILVLEADDIDPRLVGLVSQGEKVIIKRK